ncbi:MAG: DUF3151 family protein [Acidimicrobiales bacterium]
MSSHDVRFGGTGIPRTVLEPEPAERMAALQATRAIEGPARREAVAAIVASAPRSLFAWAELGDLGRDTIEKYSAYRIGYHRGLDALRQSGWRGSGYVTWEAESNRGFLRCLSGLQACATEIAEIDEAERCDLFLRQLDPSWPPSDT